MVKPIFKMYLLVFKKNFIRLSVIIGLTAVSIGIVSGIGEVPNQIRNAIEGWQLTNPAGYYEASFYADGIERISFVFPLLFLIVTAMVVFMTLTRLVESERRQIGCLITLGYAKHTIIGKYIVFTLVGAIIGGAIGILIGDLVFLPVLYNAIQIQLYLPDMGTSRFVLGSIFSVILVGFMLLVTYFAVWSILNDQPADIFRGKSLKHKHKSLYEHLPLWHKVPYKHKSTIRNIFRYKMRFFITVFSVLLGTVLIFAGFSLMFVLMLREEYAHLYDALGMISFVIVGAAIALTTLVTFNITNINIEERKKEIATLKVLGYKNLEVVGYIFREIMILTFIGVILGLPIGYGVMYFIFDFLEFGNVAYIEWYVWIISAAVSLLSLALTDLLLFNKIDKVNMNSSLKVLE